MKKLLLFVFVFAALSSCDDGDLTVENINFDDVALQRCTTNNFLLYKIAGSECLILYLPQDDAFLNETTGSMPRTYSISSTNRVVYRNFNGNIGSGAICDIIPPASPTVQEEWLAQSGTIEITTTLVISDNPNLPGGERITGYRHAVVLKNVDFLKPNGTSQFYSTFNLGNFTSPNSTTFPFAFAQDATLCGGNRVFNYINSEALTLDIDINLIENAETPIGNPRIGYTGSATNRLSYRLFANAPLSSDYFCTTPPPLLPVVTEEWVADAGDAADQTGIIEVITTSSGPGVFLHEIRLKNVRLRKGNSSFILATNYLLGYLITS
jgi:hypothetical protein